MTLETAGIFAAIFGFLIYLVIFNVSQKVRSEEREAQAKTRQKEVSKGLRAQDDVALDDGYRERVREIYE